MKAYLDALIKYAIDNELIDPCDETFVFNRLLEVMGLDSAEGDSHKIKRSLASILEVLTDDAVSRGIVEDNIVARQLFDTKLMGVLTPFPREVRMRFNQHYFESPRSATNWFYKFSQDTNYIRRDSMAKDLRWKYNGKYGELDISINLSKPEKDPKAIAAAARAPQSGYPKCLLCPENEGYAGRMNHPARQNHRIVAISLGNEQWYMQYSPYVYYNEHCIVFNSEHRPMKIDRAAFDRLFEFVGCFPHYFLGSNADLPIVGGSILSHDHFQGGNYEFAMAKAPVETPLTFKGYEDIDAGIVRWPMSVIRLTGEEYDRLSELADKILTVWRGYSDESVGIYAETDGVPHNTITPIVRRRGYNFQIDLVLRNNLTTDEYPLGVFHPHQNLHHIKKENIGLIEVMGLAVLPARLKDELSRLQEAIINHEDIRSIPEIAAHADWADEIMKRNTITSDNITDVIQQEVGYVFQQVLEDAGVYKRTDEGKAGFLRFADFVNTK